MFSSEKKKTPLTLVLFTLRMTLQWRQYAKFFLSMVTLFKSGKGHPYHPCVVVAERKNGKWMVWLHDPMSTRKEIPVLAMQLADSFKQSVSGFHGEQTAKQFDCFNRSFLFLTNPMFNDIRLSSKLTYVS